MKNAISYYSSDNLKRQGLKIEIKNDILTVTKGYLTLPNNKTAVLENNFEGKIKDDSQVIALMLDLESSKGIIIVLSSNIYDRMKYKLFERLAWRNKPTNEWVAIKYIKTGTNMKKISGGNTIKGTPIQICQNK